MSEIHWLNAVNGTFSDAADWSGGVVPNQRDDAILDAAGAPFTVTVDSSATVNSIQLAANATLDLVGGTFTATDGTGAGVNAGTITLGQDARMVVGGVLNNTGDIVFSMPEDGIAGLQLASNTTLSGAGTVTSAPRSHFDIEAGYRVGTVTLTNLNDTISGSGSIGLSSDGRFGVLTFINQEHGVIDAGKSTITFGNYSTVNTLYNVGILESDGGSGILRINTTNISGSGGKIIANGGNIELQDCVVAGQALVTKSTGAIEVGDGSSVTLEGAIKNAGRITFGADLTLEGNVNLTGGGTLTMSEAVVTGTQSSVVLTNVDNTISGSGTLGGGGMVLVNEAGGTIQAADAITPQMTIDTGSNTIVNAGLIEAGSVSGPSTILDIDSAIANSGVITDNYAGTITVEGAVTGSGQATIIGGGSLDFESKFNQDVTFAGEDIGQAGILKLARSQAYTATISGFSSIGKSKLELLDIDSGADTALSFSGTSSGGVLTVTDGVHTAHIALSGDYLGSTFSLGARKGHGVIVTAEQSGHAVAAIHPFVSAMASLGASTGELVHFGAGVPLREAMLTGPRVALA